MRYHELKTDPEMFAMSFCGSKNFEIRENDRNFEIGDILILRETYLSGEQLRSGSHLQYTGRILTRIVNYILPGGKYGLADGFVIMDVAKV